jgi:hypothetical protein
MVVDGLSLCNANALTRTVKKETEKGKDRE